MATQHLLIVDDDLRLRSLLESYLQEQGFAVHGLADGTRISSFLRQQSVDLIVLDLGLPGEDGLSLCRRLRAESDVPVLMLTARGDEVDRILGLEMGADDYLPKPFNPRELLARIHAILRRLQPRTRRVTGTREALQCGPFRIDFNARTLFRDGVAQRLTSGEMDLLLLLAEHAGQPLSREQLLLLSRGRRWESFDRSIDVLISRLRRILEEDPTHPRYLQTVWGHGYVFLCPDA
ncbi:response regulator [Acidithiobacillus sp. IBUN Pt1247-S3]|uniref:response regulator n=1 Tax=Acidithiobacillus sp. IBUN Pt1247-S3 TaxID=3166642 RepID=UPI0034E4A0A1